MRWSVEIGWRGGMSLRRLSLLHRRCDFGGEVVYILCERCSNKSIETIWYICIAKVIDSRRYTQSNIRKLQQGPTINDRLISTLQTTILVLLRRQRIRPRPGPSIIYSPSLIPQRTRLTKHFQITPYPARFVQIVLQRSLKRSAICIISSDTVKECFDYVAFLLASRQLGA